MKISVLLFPLSIIGMLIVVIMLVKPEISTIMANNDALKVENATLQNISEKNRVISALDDSLTSRPNDESFIGTYLPRKRYEERLINGLNYLATYSEVEISSLEFVEARSLKDDILIDPETGLPLKLSYERDPKKSTITVKCKGKYENIKGFIDRVYFIDMFSKIISFDIDSGKEQDSNGESILSDQLNSEVEIDFYYLPDILVAGERNYEASIFNAQTMGGGFNFALVEDLKNFISKTTIPAIEEFTGGRSNPFLP